MAGEDEKVIRSRSNMLKWHKINPKQAYTHGKGTKCGRFIWNESLLTAPKVDVAASRLCAVCFPHEIHE